MTAKLPSVSSVLMVFSTTVPPCQIAICIVRIQLHKKVMFQLERVPSMRLKLATLLHPGISLMMELSMRKTSRDAPLSPCRQTKTIALHTYNKRQPTTIAARRAQVNMAVIPKRPINQNPVFEFIFQVINVIEKLQQDVNRAILAVPPLMLSITLSVLAMHHVLAKHQIQITLKNVRMDRTTVFQQCLQHGNGTEA